MDLILTIPATSAEAERGFSSMKKIKTDLRNRMQQDSLNTLLRIVLLSPPEEVFDPLSSVNLWLEACGRRESRGLADTVTPDSETEDNIQESDDSDSDYAEV